MKGYPLFTRKAARLAALALFSSLAFAPAAHASATCTRRSSWPNGSVFDCVATAPQGMGDTTGWSVSFTLDANVTQAWNVSIEGGNNPRRRFYNLSYNASLSQPQSFGFIIDSETAAPADVVLELQLPPPGPVPPPPPVVPPPPPVTPPPPVVPPPPPAAEVPLPAPGWFAAIGPKIVSSTGAAVRFTGVSWFGLETTNRAPHGLWARSYQQLLASAKAAGFNFIRVPFSDDIFRADLKPNGIDFTKNPTLQGLTSLQILDKVVAEAGRIGLRVMLDRHRPDGNGQSELWYTGAVSEATWISHWTQLARRYKASPTVFAVDLHNEPHGAATWGSGDASTDWRLAAERAGNAILKENPNLLIVVEGIEHTGNDWYWWGGNLADAGTAPVRLSIPGRVVYSPHDYPASVYNQSWFGAPNYPSNLPGVWQPHWGYLVEQGQAPVLVGEFGTKLATQRDEQWLASLVQYMAARGMSFAFWSLNPNSGDTGGILENDWITLDTKKIQMLKPALAPLVGK